MIGCVPFAFCHANFTVVFHNFKGSGMIPDWQINHLMVVYVCCQFFTSECFVTGLCSGVMERAGQKSRTKLSFGAELGWWRVMGIEKIQKGERQKLPKLTREKARDSEFAMGPVFCLLFEERSWENIVWLNVLRCTWCLPHKLLKQTSLTLIVASTLKGPKLAWIEHGYRVKNVQQRHVSS